MIYHYTEYVIDLRKPGAREYLAVVASVENKGAPNTRVGNAPSDVIQALRYAHVELRRILNDGVHNYAVAKVLDWYEDYDLKPDDSIIVAEEIS